MPPEKNPEPTPEGPHPKYRLYAEDGTETVLGWLLRYLSTAREGTVTRADLRLATEQLYDRREWTAKDRGRRRLLMILRQLADAGIIDSCRGDHVHVRDRDRLVNLLKTRRVLPPESGAVTGAPCGHCGRGCINGAGDWLYVDVDQAGLHAPHLETWQPARKLRLCHPEDPAQLDCYTQVTRDRRPLRDTVPPARFVCPICGRRSWSTDHRAQGWCTGCREHTAEPGSGGTAMPQ